MVKRSLVGLKVFLKGRIVIDPKGLEEGEGLTLELVEGEGLGDALEEEEGEG